MAKGVLTMIAGALFGVAGYCLHGTASTILATGGSFWGARWLFLDIMHWEAHAYEFVSIPVLAVAYQLAGIGMLAIGGVVILAGVTQMVRRT